MVKKISLTRGLSTEVDDIDYWRLNQYKWHAMSRATKHKDEFIAARAQHIGVIDGKQKQNTILMHRDIIEQILIENGELEFLEAFRENPHKYHVDHIDGNSLKNTRDNLRAVTARQNAQNRHHDKTSKYPGVFWHTSRRKWRADIYINGKSKQLGFFDDEKDAANAYKEACASLGIKVIEKVKING